MDGLNNNPDKTEKSMNQIIFYLFECAYLPGLRIAQKTRISAKSVAEMLRNRLPDKTRNHMRMKPCVQAAALLLPGFLALPSHAQLQPLWEAGIGLGALDAPDYRGSDVRSTYLLPVPYLVYRGKFLKADRNGVRAALLQSDRMEINLSLNATLPVSSKNNPVRRGMADLKPTVELGPTADFNLWMSDDRKTKLDFRVPLRAAITLQSSPKHIGWLLAPGLNLSVTDPAGWSGWNLGMAGGPLFSDRRYNSYFYSVGVTEATASRPAYAAAGGYSGTRFTATLSKRFSHYWVGAFVRQDNLAGAIFIDSPLVQRRNGVSAGMAFAWIFGASSTRVEATE